MTDLLKDLRYATRRLAAAPGFTVVAALTLALGIGATTAIYSVIDALMLRPLPYPSPERLVELRVGRSRLNMPVDQFLEWRAQDGIFDAIQAYQNKPALLTGAGEPELARGTAIGGGLMAMLGANPQLGRAIQDSDAEPGHEQVVVLSDGFWRARFGADPGIIGRSIRLDDKSYEVIGIMPAWFRFPSGQRHFWVPLVVVPHAAGRPPAFVTAIARVRSDVTVAQAQTRADAVAAGLQQVKPARAGWKVTLSPPLATNINAPVRKALYVLAGAVCLVLLIACANLANLLLAQGANRHREIAVRQAIGASRFRLVRQLLTETLVLALLGGAGGVLLARAAVGLLGAYTPNEMTFLTANPIVLDQRIGLFAVGLTMTTVLLFGMLPALKNAQTRLHETLKAGSLSTTGAPRQGRLRATFVIVQIALSVMLLVSAGLLLRTFTRLNAVHPGFETSHIVSGSLGFPGWKYSSADSRARFAAQVVERIKGIPGVGAAIVTGGMPPERTHIMFDIAFEIEGRGVVLHDKALIVPFSPVHDDYFSVMGIPLKVGRTFSAEDGPKAPKAIVISESMARQLWKGESPIGQRIRFGAGEAWYTVVGVVGNVFQFEHAHPRDQFAFYQRVTQTGETASHLVVRATGDPAPLVPVIRQAIRDIDPDQTLSDLSTSAVKYAEFFDVPRFNAWLISSLALIGLAIAAVGLYGVLAYVIALRTREFGIRMALGARRADVLRLVLRNGAMVTALGILLGTIGSLILTRAMESMIFEVERTDPSTYVAVAVTLTIVAFVACWIPARRATHVDPVVALRCE